MTTIISAAAIRPSKSSCYIHLKAIVVTPQSGSPSRSPARRLPAVEENDTNDLHGVMGFVW